MKLNFMVIPVWYLLSAYEFQDRSKWLELKSSLFEIVQNHNLSNFGNQKSIRMEIFDSRIRTKLTILSF